MSQEKPLVYLLLAEDEFAASQFLREMESRADKEGMGGLNTQRLDGREINLEQLRQAVLTIPFLVERRLVIVDHPLALVHDENSRQKFLNCLEEIPQSTALVLVEHRLLTEGRERQSGKKHWLEIWAEEHKPRVWMREFPLKSGTSMVQWIISRTKEVNGMITTQAAERLAELVGEDSRLAENEIHKLLDFVNYSHPIEIQDVDLLVPYGERAGDFALINAIRQGDGRAALKVLHNKLKEEDAMMIFFSIVHQFRQIYLARIAMDEGQTSAEIIKTLSRFRIAAYPARLAIEQAQRFRLGELRQIYQRLFEIDVAIKNGELDSGVALETLVVALTHPQVSH
ncbi:MAG: DNA polymerase III subunit delta [Anaerolineales bacterium]